MRPTCNWPKLASLAFYHFRQLDTTGRCSTIFTRKPIFYDFLFAFLHSKSLLKRNVLEQLRMCF